MHSNTGWMPVATADCKKNMTKSKVETFCLLRLQYIYIYVYRDPMMEDEHNHFFLGLKIS